MEERRSVNELSIHSAIKIFLLGELLFKVLITDPKVVEPWSLRSPYLRPEMLFRVLAIYMRFAFKISSDYGVTVEMDV